MNMASEVYEMNLEDENNKLKAEVDSYKQTIKKEYDKREALEAKIAELQAKIDRLMLEFCPDEMTREQLDKWGECQKPVDKHKGE